MILIGPLSLHAEARNPATRAPECTITGTPEADVLEGTDGADVICGLGGDDTINAGAGTVIGAVPAENLVSEIESALKA